MENFFIMSTEFVPTKVQKSGRNPALSQLKMCQHLLDIVAEMSAPLYIIAGVFVLKIKTQYVGFISRR